MVAAASDVRAGKQDQAVGPDIGFVCIGIQIEDAAGEGLQNDVGTEREHLPEDDIAAGRSEEGVAGVGNSGGAVDLADAIICKQVDGLACGLGHDVTGVGVLDDLVRGGQADRTAGADDLGIEHEVAVGGPAFGDFRGLQQDVQRGRDAGVVGSEVPVIDSQGTVE